MTAPLKFLIDVGVGRSVERWLAENGYDVRCVRDIDCRLPDPKILEIATVEERMVITMDKDFGELVHRDGHGHHGVLILRLDDAGSGEKRAAIASIFDRFSVLDMTGRFCVYQDGRLRIR